MIAKTSPTELERLGGAESGGSSYPKTELVDAKLEMVHAGWVLQHAAIVRGLCWFDRVDRVQRDEID